MPISQYDSVLLKSGKRAVIVEVLEKGKAYLADVSIEDGWDEDDTIFVSHDEIEIK